MIERMMKRLLQMVEDEKPLTERQQRIYKAYKEVMDGKRKPKSNN